MLFICTVSGETNTLIHFRNSGGFVTTRQKKKKKKKYIKTKAKKQLQLNLIFGKLKQI